MLKFGTSRLSLVLNLVDTDCEGDLVCYSRSAFDPVPGCEGDGEENFDYCVPPDTPEKALDFVGDEANNYYALKACQGGAISLRIERPTCFVSSDQLTSRFLAF